MKKAIVIAFCGIGCGMMIAHAAITQLPFNAAALPKGIVCTGRVVDGARWTDSTGENIVVLCQTGAFKSPKGDSEDSRDAELSAHQYVRSAPAWKRVWSIRDFERNCPLDLTATFIPGALTVTDLDGNGIAEVTVLYKHACRGDVSPAGMKLIMREGAKKYAIRGIMRISPEIDPSGRGEMNLDPTFAKAPRSFRDFAIQHWKKHEIEKSFEQP